jgi:predicted DNA binding protein
MWSAKISFDGSKNVAGAYAKKRGIRILVLPLNWSYEKEGVYITYAGTLFGDEKDKKNFIRDWKKDKSGVLLDVELNGDLFVGRVIEPLEEEKIYNKNLIYTRPGLIEKDGTQVITLNSFEKKYLEEFIATMEKFHKIKINYIRKEKVRNISFMLTAPDLTEKQKKAMALAIESGYYDYPRKTSVKKLAESSRLGFATFHGHLRKAEQKIMPFFFKK